MIRIVSPQNLSVAWIVSKINPPGFSATCVVRGTYRIVHNGEAELVEESAPPSGDLFHDNNPDNSCVYESDFAPYKPNADLSFIGKCHVPDQKTARSCKVVFQVGDYSKTLQVFGDREWIKTASGIQKMSEPEPFREMDLIYENSFGGSDYKDNPHGKGTQELIGADGRVYHPIPNIEDPAHQILSPDEFYIPAGYCPQGRMWPRRMAGRVGTYDQQWLKERWPYFPNDFDWGYFNSAPSELQVDGYLTGDEKLYLENLHEDHPIFTCDLPRSRVRCFVTKCVSEAYYFQEVRVNLDTLCVNMVDGASLDLVWRGNIDIDCDGLDEIQHCFVIAEQLGQGSESLEYYKQLLSRLLLEEDTFPAIKPMEIQKIDDSWIMRMNADFIDMDKKILEFEEKVIEAEKSARENVIDEMLGPKASCISTEVFQPLTVKQALTRAAELETAMRVAEPERAHTLPPPMTDKEIDEIDRSFQFDPIKTPSNFPEPFTRKMCEEKLEGEDTLERADLSDLDLSRVDFSNSNCRQADFRNSILTGANFTNANLTGACFAGCTLKGLNLKGAVLTSADLYGADLSEANLSGAILDDTILVSANLENANLDCSRGIGAIFVKAELRHALLSNSDFTLADFEKAGLESVDFTRSVLVDASVEGAAGRNVIMTSADITRLRASEGPDFSNGVFRGVSAVESIWEDAKLENADFSKSQLMGGDFSNADLTRACFSDSDLSQARLEKAKLVETEMRRVNLFQGSLEKAQMVGTDFSGSNLYEVAFYLAQIERVRFDGTNLKMTMLQSQE